MGPTAVALCRSVFWFVLERVLRLCWQAFDSKESDHKRLQRLAKLSINFVHAVVATVLSVNMIVFHTGFGMDGSYDYDACIDVPAALPAIEWSCAWVWWDLAVCIRDLRQVGPIMLLHALVMLGGIGTCLELAYMKQMMATLLLQEMTTPLLNIRRIMLELYSERTKSMASFQIVTVVFGIVFILVRIIISIPRTAIHLWIGFSMLASGKIPPCATRSGIALDVSLNMVQVALNCFWARAIILKAINPRAR